MRAMIARRRVVMAPAVIFATATSRSVAKTEKTASSYPLSNRSLGSAHIRRRTAAGQGGAMMRHPRYLAATLCVIVMSASGLVHVQERVITGPPPGERAAIDAIVKALNADAAGWDATAQDRFSPELLTKQTAADRRAGFEKLRQDFGSIKVGRITRRGPDAPVEMQ